MWSDTFKVVYGISTWLAAVIGIAGIIAGVAGAWAVLRYKVKRIEHDISNISDYPDRYVLGKHCVEIRREISAAFCKKIDEVKTQLRQMDSQREEARIDFAKLMVRIDGFLKHAEN